MLDFLKTIDTDDTISEEEIKQEESITPIKQPNNNISNNKIKVGNREMTPEEYRQYQEFQRQFPDIDWGADAMYTGYETQTISTVPTPLRIK